FRISEIGVAENPSCTSVKARQPSFYEDKAPGKLFRASKVSEARCQVSERRQAVLDPSEYKQSACSPSNRRWSLLQSCCDFLVSGEYVSGEWCNSWFTFRARFMIRRFSIRMWLRP